MYKIDRHDSVRELTDMPQSDTGAPQPELIADDHTLRLFYLINSWSKDALEPPPPPGTDPHFAVAGVELEWPRAHYFGPPNDEALSGHPLYERGLRHYGVYEILQSSWIRLLERMNRVHHRHTASAIAKDRHFIITFEDTTFECIAEGYRCSRHVDLKAAYEVPHHELEGDPRFLRRIERARRNLREGRGVRLEDVD